VHAPNRMRLRTLRRECSFSVVVVVVGGAVETDAATPSRCCCRCRGRTVSQLVSPPGARCKCRRKVVAVCAEEEAAARTACMPGYGFTVYGAALHALPDFDLLDRGPPGRRLHRCRCHRRVCVRDVERVQTSAATRTERGERRMRRAGGERNTGLGWGGWVTGWNRCEGDAPAVGRNAG